MRDAFTKEAQIVMTQVKQGKQINMQSLLFYPRMESHKIGI